MSPKSVLHVSKVSRRSPQWHIFIWNWRAAEFYRNYFPLPRTPNSIISQYRSNVSSNRSPRRQQPISTISVTTPSGAKYRSARVHKTRFWGEKFAQMCKNTVNQLAKGNAVNDKSLFRTVQQNFYMDNFLKSVRTPQEAIEIYQKVRDILIKGGFNLTKWIIGDDEVKS